MANRIVVQANGLCDWKARLASPELHWKRGRSAFELAVAWTIGTVSDRGLPLGVAAILDQTDATKGAVLLLGVPEHKVALPGKGFGSQSDLWALLRGDCGYISMGVEGKAGEKFDKTVREWAGRPGTKDNRDSRIRGLCECLQLAEVSVLDVRYQLIHRTVAAVLEARRFGANQAVMLVQSFGSPLEGFGDFSDFASCFGVKAIGRGQLTRVCELDGVQLSIGWLDCGLATDADVATATD